MAVNIVLADAQVAPVNHTFKPIGLDAKGVFWFVDQSQANAIGYWKISVEITHPANAQSGQSSANRTYRYRLGLHEPVLEVPGDSSASGLMPAPTVAYIPRSFTEYVMPERSSEQNRKDLRKMTAGLSNDAQITSVIESLAYLN